VSLIVFAPDLMDRSRIAAAHTHAVFATRADDLVTLVASAASPRAADKIVVVVDLSRASALDAITAVIAAAGATPSGLKGLRVIGFASHVDDRLIAAGRAAGAEVLPRSRFFARLATLLG
jgi:hypothetical protein